MGKGDDGKGSLERRILRAVLYFITTISAVLVLFLIFANMRADAIGSPQGDSATIAFYGALLTFMVGLGSLAISSRD